MGRVAQLSLYRRILRMHQRKLPEVHRAIGDRYVRQEFRAAGAQDKAPTPEQEVEFMRQWTEYVAHLEVEAALLGVGRDLADDVVESLSEEQRVQLDKLRKHTENLRRDV